MSNLNFGEASEFIGREAGNHTTLGIWYRSDFYDEQGNKHENHPVYLSYVDFIAADHADLEIRDGERVYFTHDAEFVDYCVELDIELDAVNLEE